LKKRSKKLLNPVPSLSSYSEPRLVKVFWFFFSKKNAFLPSLDRPSLDVLSNRRAGVLETPSIGAAAGLA
jgi:hypothetical protein